MIIAQALTATDWIVVGILLTISGLLLYRGASYGHASSSAESPEQEETPPATPPTDAANSSLVQQMEARLHDYDQEIGGRMQSTIAVLDQLMLEADREIERLETLLQNTQKLARRSSRRPKPDIVIPSGSSQAAAHRQWPTDEQRRMVHFLNRAGFPVDKIAQCLERSLEEIQRVLNDAPDHRSEAA